MDLEARPGTGYAGTDPKHGSAHVDSQDAFDCRAIHPARRSRVPGPASSADVGGRRIHIRTDHIGLDLVALSVRGRTRMIDGVEQRTELARAIAVSEMRECQRRPQRRVSVLPAVFA